MIEKQALYDSLQDQWTRKMQPTAECAQPIKWIVVWKKDEYSCQYMLGPFDSYWDAYSHLCEMPAIGSDAKGHKYVEPLLTPPFTPEA